MSRLKSIFSPPFPFFILKIMEPIQFYSHGSWMHILITHIVLWLRLKSIFSPSLSFFVFENYAPIQFYFHCICNKHFIMAPFAIDFPFPPPLFWFWKLWPRYNFIPIASAMHILLWPRLQSTSNSLPLPPFFILKIMAPIQFYSHCICNAHFIMAPFAIDFPSPPPPFLFLKIMAPIQFYSHCICNAHFIMAPFGLGLGIKVRV